MKGCQIPSATVIIIILAMNDIIMAAITLFHLIFILFKSNFSFHYFFFSFLEYFIPKNMKQISYNSWNKFHIILELLMNYFFFDYFSWIKILVWFHSKFHWKLSFFKKIFPQQFSKRRRWRRRKKQVIKEKPTNIFHTYKKVHED